MASTLRTALFVDLESIYYSLQGQSQRAASALVTQTEHWLQALEDGSLLSGARDEGAGKTARRILVRRLYADPSLLRGSRQYFTRAAFNVVDCPALTGTGKNASDIRMIMDIVGYLSHSTAFDEFMILSADADFTPVLLKLREYDRRSVIFDNGVTAAAYRSAADGFVDMDDLGVFLEGPDRRSGGDRATASEGDLPRLVQGMKEALLDSIGSAPTPISLPKLAGAVRRAIGDETVRATDWGGYQTFTKFLSAHLPAGLTITWDRGGHVVDPTRHDREQSTRLVLAA